MKVAAALACLAFACGVEPASANLEEGVRLIQRGDIPEAYLVLRKAALAGDGKAARALGEMLEREIVVGRHRVVEARPEEAAGWFLHAYEHGDKLSAQRLGVMCYQGRGVKRSIEESLQWFARHRPDGKLKRFPEVDAKDHDEVVAWWHAVSAVASRHVRFPRSATYSNSWGVVEVRIDAASGKATIAKSDAIEVIQDAARDALEEALRQMPPPKAAADAKLKGLFTFDFRLLGPGETAPQ